MVGMTYCPPPPPTPMRFEKIEYSGPVVEPRIPAPIVNCQNCGARRQKAGDMCLMCTETVLDDNGR